MTNKLLTLILMKTAKGNETKRARALPQGEASHQNISNFNFDAKLRFALLSPLRSYKRNTNEQLIVQFRKYEI